MSNKPKNTVTAQTFTLTEWKREGIRLAKQDRANAFEIGDWYIAGQQAFGRQAVRDIIQATGWTGVKYDSVKIYACLARGYPKEFRRLNVSPSHFQTARALGLPEAVKILEQAATENWSLNKLRIAVRKIRFWREPNGTDIATDLAGLIAARQKFRAILADPPWQWTTTPGKKGASECHYPTMSLEELCALPVNDVAADDSFLFLWVPPATLENGLALLKAWGYLYRTNATWDKLSGGFGIGHYFRMEHEHLLLGLRPAAPHHFDDRDTSSMIRIKRSRRHSEKPPEIHQMVQRAISGPYLELFGRKRVQGWTVSGNQLPPLEPDTTVD